MFSQCTNIFIWAKGNESKGLGQFSSVAQLCATLCDPMDCSMPGLPVHHQLPEFTQTHVHWVSNAIQPSHPLPSPSPPTLNLSQHLPLQMSQLFASGGQSIGVSASTSVLPVNTQDWSPLGWTGWISLQSKGLSRVFSNTTVQKLALWVSKSFSLETFHRGIAEWSKAEGITRRLWFSCCQSMGSQRLGCAWATELNWRYWWFTWGERYGSRSRKSLLCFHLSH